MNRITLVVLCLISLTTLGLYSETSDRPPPAPDSDVAARAYFPGTQEGRMQPPELRRGPAGAFPLRAPTFDIVPLSMGHGGVEEAAPVSLASGDFDEDGVPDLLCGYAGAGGGLVTLHRGNVDSIFPFSAAAHQRRVEGTFTGKPFLASARTIDVRFRPDFLGVGDFDNDGSRDVVVGTIDATTLFLLTGDGAGGLHETGTVTLPGRLTAMIAGEVNRRDGLADIVVAIVGPEGPAALVYEGFEGAFYSEPEVLYLPAPATSLALAPLVSYAAVDLVIGAERQLLIVRGRDRKIYLGAERQAEVGPPEVVRIDFDATVRAVASGDLMVDSEGLEIAVLFDDGTVRLLGAGNTADHWTIGGEWQIATSPVAPWSLQAARVSGSFTDDLVVLDVAEQRLVVVGGRAAIGSIDLQAPPIAVLPMRLDHDALMDFVLLAEGRVPRVALSALDAVITVDTAADSATAGDGSCSLREAITNANGDTDSTGGDCTAGDGPDTILFNVAGGGSAVAINLTAPLPDIVDSVTIDGDSQACSLGPCVELRGSLAGVGVNGLTLTAGSNTVRGLVIRDFDLDGISLDSAGNFVEGNFIGTDRSGTVAAGNGVNGVTSQNADNTIGGTAPGAGNLISGNGASGIGITGRSAAANVVQGNLLGTDAAGTADLGNGSYGVIAKWSPGNVIGGTSGAARNVVSGNDIAGVRINQPEAAGNLVQGNFVGTDVSGTAALGNTNAGVVALNGAADNSIGGTAIGASNLCSGNTWGVVLYSDATGNLVLGNFVGTDLTGTVALGNLYNGVQIEGASGNIVGGAVPYAGNLISGNLEHGVVLLDGAGQNTIQGNLIGTDITLVSALGNGANGVIIQDAPNNTVGGAPPAGNIISGNAGNGVYILYGQSSSNQITGNFIGTDLIGSADLGNALRGVSIFDAPDNIIGGMTAGAGNVISGNDQQGVRIWGAPARGNQVLGNRIGTDSSGTADLGNTLAGVLIRDTTDNTIGGLAEGAANVISGNGTAGVAIVSQAGMLTSANKVQGNRIGTDVTGTILLGNDNDGVIIEDASGNAVGGTSAGAGNLIAGNGECGVEVYETTSLTTFGNAILGNSIVSNIGMGIDHGDDGITTNDTGDPDRGPNLLQNFPVVTSADATPAGIAIDGTFNSSASSDFRLEFFTSTECDDSGCGEGERYLGFEDVTTDSSGNAVFSVALPAPVSDGDSITATATDSNYNTSEFADCLAAVCQSLATLGQMVGAADKETLVWASASDVRYVKGDLAFVDSYVITGDGTLVGAASLDISGDSPLAGAGLYYLMRPLGCGSWQTDLGSEPGRDPALP